MTHIVVNTSGALTAVLTGTITDITQASPGVVTVTAHALATGDNVFVEDVVGMTEVNDTRFTITVLTADTFELDGENTSGYTAYDSAGTIGEIRQLFATVTDGGNYTLVVDATDLTGSEQLELRIFGKARSVDTERLAYYVSVVGDQALDLKISLDVMSPHHFRATLEQTGGTGRAYEWAIYGDADGPGVSASAEQTAVLTTEHTLQELTDSGEFQVAVDTANLTGSEQLELRVYGKARSGDTERLMYYGSFVGDQATDLKFSENIPSPHHIKATLEQTGGTGRAYPWAIYERSGLLVPLTIADLAAWYKADAGITLNGSNVSGWAEQSGNGDELVQGTEANQPDFLSSSQNGLPGVDFIEANADILATAGGTVLDNIWDGGGYVLFVISPDDLDAGSKYIMGKDESTARGWFLKFEGLSGGAYRVSHNVIFDGGGAAWNTNNRVVPVDTAHLVDVAYDADTATNDPVFAVDASVVASADSSGTGTRRTDAANAFSVGAIRPGGTPLLGDNIIYEIIIYSSIPSSADQARLRGYLNDKWALY